MVETNPETGEKKVFCDRCGKELIERVVAYTSGDCVCEECFHNEYKIITVGEYLNG